MHRLISFFVNMRAITDARRTSQSGDGCDEKSYADLL